MLTVHPGTKTLRGRSAELWADLDVDGLAIHQDEGAFRSEDFQGGLPNWTLTNLNSATATATAQAVVGGAVRLDPGAVTIQHGAQYRENQWLAFLASGALYWETLIRLTTISTKPKLFVGLAASGTVVGGTSELNVEGVGFRVNQASGRVDFVSRTGSTTHAVEDVYPAIVDGAWLHLGFKCRNRGKIVPFVNGTELPPSKWLAGSTLPPATTILARTHVVCSGGTVRPTMDVDWSDVGMLANADIR